MSIYEDMQRAQALRAELRKIEQRVERDSRQEPITEADERRMARFQAVADAAYQAVDRKAPPPLAYERPREYERRIVDGLKGYSPHWAKADVMAMADDAFKAVAPQIFDAAKKAGPTYDLGPTDIKAIQKDLPGGHKVVEFVGGKDAHFVRRFRGDVYTGHLRSRDQYAQMTRDANLSRIDEIIHRRPVPQPRAGF